jgi:hypothetical protein
MQALVINVPTLLLGARQNRSYRVACYAEAYDSSDKQMVWFWRANLVCFWIALKTTP